MRDENVGRESKCNETEESGRVQVGEKWNIFPVEELHGLSITSTLATGNLWHSLEIVEGTKSIAPNWSWPGNWSTLNTPAETNHLNRLGLTSELHLYELILTHLHKENTQRVEIAAL